MLIDSAEAIYVTHLGIVNQAFNKECKHKQIEQNIIPLIVKQHFAEFPFSNGRLSFYVKAVRFYIEMFHMYVVNSTICSIRDNLYKYVVKYYYENQLYLSKNQCV